MEQKSVDSGSQQIGETANAALAAVTHNSLIEGAVTYQIK
jgi:hypothetical protein